MRMFASCWSSALASVIAANGDRRSARCQMSMVLAFGAAHHSPTGAC